MWENRHAGLETAEICTHVHTDGQLSISERQVSEEERQKRRRAERGGQGEKEMSENWQATDDCMKTLHLSASDPQTHTHTHTTNPHMHGEISIVNAYWLPVSFGKDQESAVLYVEKDTLLIYLSVCESGSRYLRIIICSVFLQ